MDTTRRISSLPCDTHMEFGVGNFTFAPPTGEKVRWRRLTSAGRMGWQQAAHLGANVLQGNGRRSVIWRENVPECNRGGHLNALVVVRHAVDVAVMVDGEGHAVQGLGAHHAAEAAGVVGVPQSLQDLGTQNHILEFQFLFPKKKTQTQNGAGGSDRLCCGYLCGTNMVKSLLS